MLSQKNTPNGLSQMGCVWQKPQDVVEAAQSVNTENTSEEEEEGGGGGREGRRRGSGGEHTHENTDMWLISPSVPSEGDV